MRMKPPITSLLAAVLLAAQASPARATLATEIQLPAMTESADLIVRGTVEKRRTTDENGRLFTQVTIKATEVHKGTVPASGRVVIRTVGGAKGLIISRVDGEPEFALGQEVLLFLDTDGFYARTVAMAQGKFDIVRDPVSRAEHIVRDLSGLAFVTFDPRGGLTIQHTDTAAAIPASYPELVSTIRRQVARTAMMRATALRAVEIARAQTEGVR